MGGGGNRHLPGGSGGRDVGHAGVVAGLVRHDIAREAIASARLDGDTLLVPDASPGADVLPRRAPGVADPVPDADPRTGAPAGGEHRHDRAAGTDGRAVAAGAATDAGGPVGRERL